MHQGMGSPGTHGCSQPHRITVPWLRCASVSPHSATLPGGDGSTYRYGRVPARGRGGGGQGVERGAGIELLRAEVVRGIAEAAADGAALIPAATAQPTSAPPARPSPATHQPCSTPGLQPRPRQPGREPTLGSHSWLQPSLAQPSNPAISPLRPRGDVIWTQQHRGSPPAPGLAPSPPASGPTQRSGGFPERAGTKHRAHHPSTPQPTPSLGHPAPSGAQHLRAPQQLLRAEGAAERAEAHLQGCHSTQASSSRVSTAPFRSAAQEISEAPELGWEGEAVVEESHGVPRSVCTAATAPQSCRSPTSSSSWRTEEHRTSDTTALGQGRQGWHPLCTSATWGLGTPKHRDGATQ